MKSNEKTPVATTTDAPTMDTSEVRKVSFWVAQLCVIVATVLGVFLAASQGFKQALAFEDVRSDKANCYLRISLRNEMTNNVAIARDYLKRIVGGSLAARRMPLNLDTYVWDNMKFSSNTLETPPDLLGANTQFLRQMNDYYARIASGDITVENGTKRVEELLEHMEKEVLPKFDANINEIKARLKKQDVEV